jgi:hypothetical protein
MIYLKRQLCRINSFALEAQHFDRISANAKLLASPHYIAKFLKLSGVRGRTLYTLCV